MSKSPSFFPALSKSPILWGSLASVGFYGLIHSSVLRSEFVQRYFASHPVEFVTTAMFFVGLAVLAIKAMDLVGQWQGVSEPLLPPVAPGGQPASEAGKLAAILERLPRRRRDHWVVRRLGEVLERVRRRGSAEGLDEELKYLADRHADEVYESYSLFRVILWAIPILGFLGTVIGITLAVAKLAPTALEDSLQEVTTGLGVAFDTTALALALSIVLMFARFLTARAENQLLARVDRCVDDEMLGRFEVMSDRPDGQLAAVRRMIEAMIQTTIQTTDGLVRRQAELWQASLETSQGRWNASAEAAGKQLQAALAGALDRNLAAHARHLAEAEHATAERNRQHWDRVQRAAVQSVEASASLQHAVNQQTEVLGRTVEATGQVARLEATLNRNLSALAGAGNFEQTVMSLAAAIHLLNARLGATPSNAPGVQLEPTRKPGHAA